MKKFERVCREFIDGLHSAATKEEFQRVAERAAQGMDFRWFAYVSGGEGMPNVITSYPRDWIERYAEENYMDVDPGVRRFAGTAGIKMRRVLLKSADFSMTRSRPAFGPALPRPYRQVSGASRC
ncbi:MAG: hypothetical protein FJX06_19645 [Alphaproteobacteria bacterium]|nr:hypothetical protein [Alphaproteobacteria bacterium]